MQRRNRWVVATLIVVGLQLSACAPTAAPAAKTEAVHVELVDGTDLKRLVLTAQAAKRLDIQTIAVREEQVARQRMVGGEVMASADGQAAASNAVWVRVSLNESDLNSVDRSQPAYILPLSDDSGDDVSDDDLEEGGLIAEAGNGPAENDDDDQDNGEGALYYRVTDAGQALEPGQRVWVRLSLVGSGAQRIVVPYAAVIYGLHGETWVYTRPAPLTFIRQAIGVDYVEGDLAVLLEGPPAGMEVVTVGGAELFGVESGVGGGH